MIEVQIYEEGEEGRAWEISVAQFLVVPRVGEYLMLHDLGDLVYEVRSVCHAPAAKDKLPHIKLFVAAGGVIKGL